LHHLQINARDHGIVLFVSIVRVVIPLTSDTRPAKDIYRFFGGASDGCGY
jgi:hypothetical protein